MNSGGKDMVRLYHYLAACWALDDIRRRRLKLSNLLDVNDPYEFACVYSTDEVTQETLEDSRPGIANLEAFTSFSDDCKNILMWSHYAEKHRGMCLGFDVNREKVRKIDYAPAVEVIGSLSGQNLIPVLERLKWTKYTGWAHEKEFRAWDEPKKDAAGLSFVSFDGDLVLKEVIAGARCTVTKQQIHDALQGYGEVKVAKLRADPKTFELIIDEHGFEVA